MGFAEYFSQKRQHGRHSLRRAQWKAAIGEPAVVAGDGTVLQAEVKPNITMQIWLGKQWLGQSDKLDQRLTGPDDGPVQIDSVEYVIIDPAINKITDDPAGSCPVEPTIS